MPGFQPSRFLCETWAFSLGLRMESWLIGLSVAAVLVLSPFVFRAWRRWRLRRRWRALGNKLELTPPQRPSHHVLEGHYRGYPVDVSLSRTGGSRLRFVLDARLPEGFALTPQGLRGAAGRQDLQVGQPVLDAAYVIQGANPAAVLRLMQAPSVRDALLSLHQQGMRVQLLGQQLVIPMRGGFTEETCRTLLRDLARLASALREAMEQHRAEADAARDALRKESPAAGVPSPVSPSRDFQKQVDFRKEFGRRWGRHKALVFGGAVAGVLVGVPLWLLVRNIPLLEGWSQIELMLTLAVVGSLAAYGWSIEHQLLCPSCGNDVRQVEPDPNEPDEETRVVLSLSRCPHCDLRLR